MKAMTGKYLESCRIREGRMGSDPSFGFNGAFRISGFPGLNDPLFVICSDGEGWDHVSVTVANARRTPTLAEMAIVKGLFFEDHEPVMQLHPAKADHINNHPYCLHLWRPQRQPIPLPPTWMVGVKGLEAVL